MSHDPKSVSPSWEDVKRDAKSTREIVADAVGDTLAQPPLAGPKRFGHNPSWVKVADVDRLRAAEAERIAAADALLGRAEAAEALLVQKEQEIQRLTTERDEWQSLVIEQFKVAAEAAEQKEREIASLKATLIDMAESLEVTDTDPDALAGFVNAEVATRKRTEARLIERDNEIVLLNRGHAVLNDEIQRVLKEAEDNRVRLIQRDADVAFLEAFADPPDMQSGRTTRDDLRVSLAQRDAEIDDCKRFWHQAEMTITDRDAEIAALALSFRNLVEHICGEECAEHGCRWFREAQAALAALEGQ